MLSKAPTKQICTITTLYRLVMAFSFYDFVTFRIVFKISIILQCVVIGMCLFENRHLLLLSLILKQIDVYSNNNALNF